MYLICYSSLPIFYPILVIENNDSLQQYIVPALAVIISFFALGVSFLSLHIQRKHNIKSVRPAGFIKLHDSLSKLHVQIVNRGCGPMQIIDFTAVRNSLVEHNIVYHLPENILKGFNARIHTKPEGYWLMPGEKLVLLKLKGNHEDKNFVMTREKVRSILCDITISLTVCDIYDKKQPVFTKSLEWFKRKL